MKKILLIGTGGTIASKHTEDGLVPGIDSEELKKEIPGLDGIDIDSVQIVDIDSTNMRPGIWIKVADCIEKNYDSYDGFVISHGTDTMAYTAAGISYLIQNNEKPIVLTGAQKPIGDYDTDARGNLRDAFIYAADDASCGTQIVFSGSVIAGTRARKNYSKRFTAFGSINYPEIARVQDGKVIRYIHQKISGDVKFYGFLDPNVGILKLVPGMRKDVMEFFLDRYDGVVIESFGVGGIPEYSDFYDQIKKAVDAGKIIVMTTQVPNEGSNLLVYRVGNVMKKELNIMEGYDLTSEAAFAKLMWALGQSDEFSEVERLFYTPVMDDMLCR